MFFPLETFLSNLLGFKRCIKIKLILIKFISIIIFKDIKFIQIMKL